MNGLRSNFYIGNYLIVPEGNLTEAKLTRANLTGANLAGANLTKADLTEAKLIGANLTGSEQSGSNLTLANLTGADLTAANLIGAELTGANLIGANLSEANLTGANLIGANLTGAKLYKTELQGAKLNEADLTAADLTKANLTDVLSGDIIGVPSILPTNWKFAKGYLIGPGIDLTGANLKRADLNGANLTAVKLRGADLTGITSGNIIGIPSNLPTNWICINGYLIGPGADLKNTDLNGVDLREADLTGVMSGSIKGKPSALPLGWELVNGYLLETHATTYKIASPESSISDDNDSSSDNNDSTPIECDHTIGESYSLIHVKDSDGNYHGGNQNLNTPDAYKYQGIIDVNNDGRYEAIYTNKNSGRWVTATIDKLTGVVDYSKYKSGNTTRVVGIYQDPNVSLGLIEKDSPLDSSYALQKDLELDNLILKKYGDYDSDGFQEVYWSKVDNTAYLRAVMHADGNIQYANYQKLDQMTKYLTDHGFADMVALIA